MEVSFCFTEEREDSLPSAAPHEHKSITRDLLCLSSQKSISAHDSSSTISLRNHNTARDTSTLTKKLKAVLGGLKMDSDAPPAVRLLVSLEDDDVSSEMECADISEKNVLAETAAPTPRSHSRTQKSCETLSEGRQGVSPLAAEDLTVSPGLKLRPIDTQDRMFDALMAMQKGVDTTGDPALFTLLPRACASRSLPKVSSGRCGQKKPRNTEEMMAVNTTTTRAAAVCVGGGLSRRRYTFCSRRVFKLPCHAMTACEKHNSVSKTMSNVSALLTDGSLPSFFFEPLGLLQPLNSVFAAASYPPSLRSVPGGSSHSDALEEVFRFRENKREALPVATEGGTATVCCGNIGQKLIRETPSNLLMNPRQCESCFSLSTPRKQSTNSSRYSSTNTLSGCHPNQASAVLWSAHGHQHTRCFSCGRISPEKTPRSPSTNSTMRHPWHPSGSVEWFQQRPLNQLNLACHLPVFLNGNGSPTSAGNGGTPLPPLANNMLMGNNSVSSLLITRTLSNVDTLPTFGDAPLDAFMDSSIYTSGSQAPFQ